MKDTRYAFSVSNVRVHESSLFGQTEMELLLAAPDCEAALSILSEHGWDTSAGCRGINQILRGELLRAWNFLLEIAPDISLLQPLVLRKDYHNLKAGIKCIQSGLAVDTYFLQPSTLPAELLVEAITRRQFSLLPEPFASVGEEAFDVLVRTSDGQFVDIVVDQVALSDILAKAKATGNVLLLDLSELFCAAANIKIAVRSARKEKTEEFLRRALSSCDTLDKNMLVSAAARGMEPLLSYLASTQYAPGTALIPESPSSFEKWCDDEGVALLERCKFIYFGPEPLISYYFAKEAEIKNVRILLAAKESQLPPDEIRKRLRRLYV
jgi:V/A-type H+-transporting ATPase subunit C